MTKNQPKVYLDTAALEQCIIQSLGNLKKDRDRFVITKRHGISQQQTATLESIGKSLGITRERVRQIEKAALKRLRESFSPSPQISDSITELINEAGGLLAFDRLISLAQIEPAQKSNLAFLIKLHDRLEFNNESDDIAAIVYTPSSFDAKQIGNIHTNLVTIFKTIGKPTKLDDVANRIDGPYSIDTIRQLAEASKIIVVFDEHWGLHNWPEVNPKSIRDKAYLVLKRVGKPLHFSEIAQGVISLKPNAKKVTTQAVHNELIKDGRFVLIGRGIYALSSWGYQEGTVADIISQVLSKKSPLSKDEIITQVLKKRQVKPTTIVLNLQEKPQFERIGKATYRLTSK